MNMDFEEFFNTCFGEFQSNGGNFSGFGSFGCDDMPNGFQDIDPKIFTLLGSLVGVISAQKLPFNVQNALGNWFELLGQVILTYNAQQQYFQNGPGHLYDIRNKNIGSSTCSNPGNSDAGDTNSNNVKRSIYIKDLDDLRKKIDDLEKKINNMSK